MSGEEPRSPCVSICALDENDIGRLGYLTWLCVRDVLGI